MAIQSDEITHHGINLWFGLRKDKDFLSNFLEFQTGRSREKSQRTVGEFGSKKETGIQTWCGDLHYSVENYKPDILKIKTTPQ